jgi:hypothetical protein
VPIRLRLLCDDLWQAADADLPVLLEAKREHDSVSTHSESRNRGRQAAAPSTGSPVPVTLFQLTQNVAYRFPATSLHRPFAALRPRRKENANALKRVSRE